MPRIALMRDQLKSIAVMRLREARVLLDTENYSGAYYLCGYAVECGLKACIAKETKRFEFPDKKFTNDCHTHNLENLVNLSGLKAELKREQDADPDFRDNWATTKDWNEISRYEEHDKNEAADLYSAISGKNHGVLRWVKKYW